MDQVCQGVMSENQRFQADYFYAGPPVSSAHAPEDEPPGGPLTLFAFNHSKRPHWGSVEAWPEAM